MINSKETQLALDSVESIDDGVCFLMGQYGPDGHFDGHEELTKFIQALCSGYTPKQAVIISIGKIEDIRHGEFSSQGQKGGA